MSVYVDAPRWRLGRMVMCHMFADSEAELHAMADKVGVARRWYQAEASTPHYDVCKAKRELAIRLGAIEISRRETVALIRRFRSSGFPSVSQEESR